MRSILFDHIPDAGLSVHQDLNIEFISQLLSEPHRELAFIATQSTPKQCLTPLPKKRQIIGRGTYKNLKKYHERYLGIYHWKKKILEEAKQEKQVKTLIGRRRLVKDINSSNRMLAARAERIAVNTVIQGTAADLVKKAMIDVDRLGVELLLQVHDELVIECSEQESQSVALQVQKIMENAYILK